MRKGQIFTVDLMLALVVIVLAIGMVTQAWGWHLEQTSSSVEHAKMQQIAIDAAALRYYTGDHNDLTASADLLGYTLSTSFDTSLDCISSTRGTPSNLIQAVVCR